MMMNYLTVDGMLSGTGIRGSVAGGYLEPTQLDLSQSLASQITSWLAQYEDGHYAGFGDTVEVAKLDAEGIRIAQQIQRELPQTKVEYYSHAQTVKLPVPPTPPDSKRPPTPRG
jgi:hypothetical protein